MNEASNTVWIIAGPTASGKSALAIELARKYDGVIINADSMQVYQEIPVISAQPSAEEQSQAPHELYGFRSITEHYSAADWARDAIKKIEEVRSEGKQPILVGGSGLYLKTLTDGLSPMPDVPQAVRNHVCDLYDMLGPIGFHEALAQVDPVIAARLHPTDRQRCIRAREVYEVSNQPLSSWQEMPKEKAAPHLEFKTLLLMPERGWLHKRINDRFVQMTQIGALEEAKHINAINSDSTGTRAVGLQELRDHVEGRFTLDEAIEAGQTASRQYAKRQYTWFRGQKLPHTEIIEKVDKDAVTQAVYYFKSLN